MKSSVITSYSIHYTKLYDISFDADEYMGQEVVVDKALVEDKVGSVRNNFV